MADRTRLTLDAPRPYKQMTDEGRGPMHAGESAWPASPDPDRSPPYWDSPDRSVGRRRQPTPEQLLALQLHDRGYSLAQIARLVGQTPSGVGTLLAQVVAALGATDVRAAVAEAKRHGLLA